MSLCDSEVVLVLEIRFTVAHTGTLARMQSKVTYSFQNLYYHGIAKIAKCCYHDHDVLYPAVQRD
jgi:hypothetical protein